MARLTIEEQKRLNELDAKRISLAEQRKSLAAEEKRELEALISLRDEELESEERKLKRLKQQKETIEEIVSTL